jgi:hypothetical protein
MVSPELKTSCPPHPVRFDFASARECQDRVNKLRWFLSRRKEEDGMRKVLLASVAALGSGGLIGTAMAQAPAGPGRAPMQGQFPYQLGNPPAAANNNNNYQAPAIPGPVANPTPGTIVLHINGRVVTEFQAAWTGVDQRLSTTTVAGTTTPGTVKLSPLALNEYTRLYLGGDAMATNGLRYGAAIEIRQNFNGQLGSNTSSNASGYTSTQTLFVRRAFTYVAGEQWGIVRAGDTDGVIGIFDNGITTSQFTFIGEFNGGHAQNTPLNSRVPYFFLSQGGDEYGNTKLVYLSPQIAGFDFGIQWAPNSSNGFGISSGNPAIGTFTGASVGTGLSCSQANSGCPSLSSGPGILDGAKATNITTVGARYQGLFAGVGVLAYGAYAFSGTVNYTGLQTPAALGTAAVPGSAFNGKYDGLSYGSGGLALTYAGFSLVGNVIGGRINGGGATVPQGGANELAYTIGLKYVTGPLTLGVAGEIGWYQGNALMAGISQRRGRAIVVGAQYAVAPGFSVAAEYLYEDIRQSGVNLASGAVGSGANNYVKGQAFVIGNSIAF